MKKLGLLLALISVNTFADCAGDYNNGVSEYNFGVRYSNYATEQYQLAVDESQKPDGSQEKLCEYLLNSYSGFNTSALSLVSCRDNFSKAVKSCSGDTKLKAMQASNLCHQNFQTSNENKGIVFQNIKTNCFSNE